MKKFWKTISCLAAAAFLAVSLPVSAYASDPLTNYLTDWPQMDDIGQDYAVVMDAENGAILYSLNRNDEAYPASITKIMTCLLVLENTEMDEIVTMSEAGLHEAYSGSSNINPQMGEEFTVEQCLYMLMLKSANDVAAQLAEHVAGDVDDFVDMMNERAEELGCEHTHFNNPNGLPDEDHYTCCEDMARIMRDALQNETFREVIHTQRYVIGPTNMTDGSRVYDNHNALIMEDDDRSFEDCIGGKTGYTDSAWRTLVESAERDGMTLISVQMHGPTNDDFNDAVELLEYGFDNFERIGIDEETDGGRFTGSVTVPEDFSLEDLDYEEDENADGDPVRYYSYEDVPVGYAVFEKTEEQEPEETAAAVTDEETDGDDGGEGSGEDTLTRSADTDDGAEDKEPAITSTTLALFVLVMLSLIFVALRVLAVHLRRQKRRREELEEKYYRDL